MNSTQLLEYWRAQVVDDVRRYLWSDDEAFVYMNEAQRMFCRLTQGIPDVRTSNVVNVPVATGEIFAETHPSILTFREATLASTGDPIWIKNHTVMRKWDNTAGSIDLMIIGLEDNLVRWGHTPMVDDEVHLLVYRLPLEEIQEDEQEFEIDKRHHVALTLWMKHLCYLKNDTETYDKNASEQGEAAFRKYCFDVSEEQNRQKHVKQPILYGGI